MYFKVVHKQTNEMYNKAIEAYDRVREESTLYIGESLKGYFTEDGYLYLGSEGVEHFYVTERGGEVIEISWEDFKENVIDKGKVLEVYTYGDIDSAFIESIRGLGKSDGTEKEQKPKQLYKWQHNLVDSIEEGIYTREITEMIGSDYDTVQYSHIRRFPRSVPIEVVEGASNVPVVSLDNLDKGVTCAYCGKVLKLRDSVTS